MAKLTITEVSQRWGVSRPTLYRYKDHGKLTFEKDGRKVVIDSSEALRVLGNPLSRGVTSSVYETVSGVTSTDNDLKSKVESLQAQVELLKDSLDHSRKSENELRGIVDRQTRLLEDKTMSGGWLSKLLGRKG
jgi:excisionase family DNA binding protein